MLPMIVADGYAAVGDSAAMTIPLNGSGINLSMNAGKLLADHFGTMENIMNADVEALTAIDQRILMVDAQLKALVEAENAMFDSKADNISYDEEDNSQYYDEVIDKVAYLWRYDEEYVSVYGFTSDHNYELSDIDRFRYGLPISSEYRDEIVETIKLKRKKLRF